jgi:hypothetical protein
MSLSFLRLQDILLRHADAIRQLQKLYTEMDARYTAAAESHDFECRGCDDNCCLTRFYHHTLVEVIALFSGYLKLPEDQRRIVTRRARDYCQVLNTDEGQEGPLRRLCPLNQATRCLLYNERPMICRLHGIPHVMQHPLKGLITGTGCHIFEATCRPGNGHPLDRTPLYRTMAHLEKALRHATGIDTPVRLTVAQMIVCFDE